MSNYRPDIDGLRALAVIPVVLFHADVQAFAGGYVGVDIFFVISGYLITSIIYREIRQERFSIVNFYERRVRRIFPALFLVLLLSTLAALLLLTPVQLKNHGQHLVGTIGFVSNLLFWWESGYFDAPSELKPLLHTWSLAVEEQFYIFFPLLLLLAHRWLQRHLIALLAGMALVSLAVSVFSVERYPSAAFYLLPSRAWELLCGALLAVGAFPPSSRHLLRETVALAGLAAIVWSVLTYSASTPFPGLSALLPCLGTAALIWAGSGQGSSLVNRGLTLRPLVFVGLISYSLYLWHWPILVFAEMVIVRERHLGETLALLVLMLALSVASWRYVERPFRNCNEPWGRRNLFAAAAGVGVAGLALGFALHLTAGLPGRISEQARMLAAGAEDINLRRKECFEVRAERVMQDRLCRLGPAESWESFAVWGDSHADALMPAFEQLARETEWRGIFMGRSACLPLPGVRRPDDDLCPDFNDAALDYLLARPDISTVFLIGRWALSAEGRRYRGEEGEPVVIQDARQTQVGPGVNREVLERGLYQTVEALQMAGKRVVVVGPVPEIGFDVPSVLAQTWVAYDIRPTEVEFRRRQAFVLELLATLEQRPGVQVVYPHHRLCLQGRCQVAYKGRSLYRDDDHLSTFGARHVVPSIKAGFVPMEPASRLPLARSVEERSAEEEFRRRP